MRAQVGDPSPSLKGTALVRNRSSPRSRPIENEARYDHNHEFHLDDDLRVLTHALREEFELKVKVYTACERAWGM